MAGGAMFARYGGRWRRSPLTPRMQLDQMQESIARAKVLTCRRVGEESVGGAARPLGDLTAGAGTAQRSRESGIEREDGMTALWRRMGRILVKGVRYWVAVLTGRAVRLVPAAGSRPAAPGQAAPKYRVLVDDNYDYTDESKRWTLGDYDTWDEALAASKALVDECLQRCYEPGMSAEKLEREYRAGGDDPFIVGGEGPVKFSAWDYASERAREMCKDKP